MFSILVAAVFAVTPFYQPNPPSSAGNHAPHVMRDHRHFEHHRRNYGGGYIGNDYEPDTSAYDAGDDDEPPARQIAIYQPAPSMPVAQEKMTFPSYTEIVVKGAPIGNGCTYKSVMTDDEINACKRAARNEANQVR
jgi:hypothetical protein